MGRKTKLREAQRYAETRAACAVLEAHSRRPARRDAPESFDDFEPAQRALIERYRDRAIRAPEAWRRRVRSRSADCRFLDLVRFTFARYPVPKHLENAWLTGGADDFLAPAEISGAQADAARPDMRDWYIIAAQGGSLYRQAAQGHLTRGETHHFLLAPDTIGSSRQAFWYAVARIGGADRVLAERIAISRLNGFAGTATFWKDAATFFSRNPLPLGEINGLVDYLAAAQSRDRALTMEGCTVASLRYQMEEWHRAQRGLIPQGTEYWPGRPLANCSYEIVDEIVDETEEDAAPAVVWHFRQIKTEARLAKEGRRMHHCVANYKYECMDGKSSIWSLMSERPAGQLNRAVTIEVSRDGCIVQVRGFGNRPPNAEETEMLRRWARDYDLEVADCAW